MKDVIVIGGGFAGSTVAKSLEKMFNVILIDTKEYFEFTPGVLRTIVEPEHVRKIQVMHSHYLRRSKVIRGKVSEVADDYILVNGKKVRFDYLVIASGSRYELPIKEENVVMVTRANRLRNCYKELCESKNVLIVGGGIVGTELAAEISTHYIGKRIVLVHSGKRLMERNKEKSSKYALNFLKKRGAEVILKERVIKFLKSGCETNKGRKINPDMIFLCTGIKPNSELMKKNFSDKLNKKKQIKVNRFLQVSGERNIFALGDVGSVSEEKTAQNAEKQADIVIHNIKNLERKKKLCEYKNKGRIMVISLGKLDGILEWKNFVLTGLIPGILKSLIERREMIKKRKLT